MPQNNKKTAIFIFIIFCFNLFSCAGAPVRPGQGLDKTNPEDGKSYNGTKIGLIAGLAAGTAVYLCSTDGGTNPGDEAVGMTMWILMGVFLAGVIIAIGVLTDMILNRTQPHDNWPGFINK